MDTGRKKTVLGFALFLVIIGVVFGVWKWWEASVPTCAGCNVIVISLDQVRAKSLPCFGYNENTAPNLCTFSAKSHIFTNAYATASRTQDSHFSMVTGLYPSSHTMTLPYASKLPPDVMTFAELLKQDGYRTYFFGPPADPHLPLTRGLERGFDKTFDADDPQSWINSMEQIATASGVSSQPSFYFMHTYFAHEPYMPNPEDLKLFYNGPEIKQMNYEDLCKYTYTKLKSMRPDLIAEVAGDTRSFCQKLEDDQQKQVTNYSDFNDVYTIFNDQFWRQFEGLPLDQRATFTHALYIAQIHMLDTALGKFFDYLDKRNLLKNTIVVIVGDQGDEFFEHTSYSHGWSLYDEVLRVPFIAYSPNSGAGRSDKLVSLVDIMPTVFRLLGKTLGITVAGYDAFSRKTHNMIISEHVSDGAVSLRTDKYTLIRRIKNGAFQLELYDRAKDPGELQNIFKNNTTAVEKLLKEYKELQLTFPKHTSTPDPLPTWINEEDKKNLIKSGYF